MIHIDTDKLRESFEFVALQIDALQNEHQAVTAEAAKLGGECELLRGQNTDLKDIIAELRDKLADSRKQFGQLLRIGKIRVSPTPNKRKKAKRTKAGRG